MLSSWPKVLLRPSWRTVSASPQYRRCRKRRCVCRPAHWNRPHDPLYLVQHGREQLDDMHPDLFTPEQRVELLAEEFHKVSSGGHLGWPYTYWNLKRDARMIAPEYGGDGNTVAMNDDYTLTGAGPSLPFTAPGTGRASRRPVTGFFVSMNKQGQPADDWSTFADGFTGMDQLMDPGNARHRPMGLAEGPDCALYISDSVGGRVWKVTYQND